MAAIDWFKIVMDYLKTNKWLLLAVLGLFGNVGQGVYGFLPAPKAIIVNVGEVPTQGKTVEQHEKEEH